MSETTAAVQPVNWEAVKMLAMAVGVRESARRMGLSEDRVRQRCTREGWLKTPEAQAVNKLAIAARSGITCRQSSPAALMQAEIASLGAKSRLSFARGIAKAAEHVEQLPGDQILAQSSDVKNVAQTADLVHGWKEAAPSVKIRLDVLGGVAEAPILDVSATEIEDISISAPSDNLDDY